MIFMVYKNNLIAWGGVEIFRDITISILGISKEDYGKNTLY